MSTQTTSQKTKSLLSRLSSRHPDMLDFALANGGPEVKLPRAIDVDAQAVENTIEDALSLDTLQRLEKQIMRRREMLRALKPPVAVTDGQALKEHYEDVSLKAEHLHKAQLTAVMKCTRPLEITARKHYSYLVEARIPPHETKLRGAIKVTPMNVKQLMRHEQFGKDFIRPLNSEGNIHQNVYGLIVADGTISLNDQVIGLGSVAGAHRALIYTSIAKASLHQLDQLISDKAGGENVVLNYNPIRSRKASCYETEDVVISGAFALAGMETFKLCVSEQHDFGTIVTGNQSLWRVSQAYSVYENGSPFIDDFGDGKYNKMPFQIMVGATATDKSETCSNANLYGRFTATTNECEWNQVQVREALNHLCRKLTIQGQTLLAGNTEEHRRDLERKLRTEMVGKHPKPFDSLDLEVDEKSVEGIAARQRGGLLLRANVKVNSIPTFVNVIIQPPVAGSPVNI